MKGSDLLQYRRNEYFNEDSMYLLEDRSTNKYYVTKVEFHKGNWYALESMRWKMTSVRCFEI